MPSVVGVGTVAAGAGTVVPGLPAGTVADDVLLLFVETGNEVLPAMTGWTDVTGSPVAMATTQVTRLNVRWKRAAGGETAPTVPDAGDHQIARIMGVRGCPTSGSPIHVGTAGTEATSDTTASFPAVTTTVPGALVVNAIATGTDPAAVGTAHYSAWTNAALTTLTERIDNADLIGNGGTLGVATGLKATPGSTGATTATVATAATKAMLTFALSPILMSSVSDTFGDGVPNTGGLWPSDYNTTPPTELGGRSQVPTRAAEYNGKMTAAIYTFDRFFVDVPTIPTVGTSTTDSYFEFGVKSAAQAAGTDAVFYVDIVANQIYPSSRTSYFDATSTPVTFTASMRRFRMTLTGTTLLFETAPAGTETWTTLRSMTAPAWLSAGSSDIAWHFEAHRGDGAGTDAEIDNFNLLGGETKTTTGTAAASATATATRSTTRTRTGTAAAVTVASEIHATARTKTGSAAAVATATAVTAARKPTTGTAAASATATAVRSTTRIRIGRAEAIATATAARATTRATSGTAAMTATATAVRSSIRVRAATAAVIATARATAGKLRAVAGTAAASATARGVSAARKPTARTAAATATVSAASGTIRATSGTAAASATASATTSGFEQHPTIGTAAASATARATSTKRATLAASASALASASAIRSTTRTKTGTASAIATARSSSGTEEQHFTSGTATAAATARAAVVGRRTSTGTGSAAATGSSVRATIRTTAGVAVASAVARAMTGSSEQRPSSGTAAVSATASCLVATRRTTTGRAAASATAGAHSAGGSGASPPIVSGTPRPIITRTRPGRTVTMGRSSRMTSTTRPGRIK